MRYRLVGVPASFSTDDDMLIEDELGRLYLLGQHASAPTPVAEQDVAMVFTFYEPVLETRWTDIGELSVMHVAFAPTLYDMSDAHGFLPVDW